MSSAPTGTSTPSFSRDRVGDAAGERHAAALDADEGQAGGARLLLDDLVADADRRPADLLRGHDVAAAHRSFPASRGLGCGLTGPTRRDAEGYPVAARPDAARPPAANADMSEHGRGHTTSEACPAHAHVRIQGVSRAVRPARPPGVRGPRRASRLRQRLRQRPLPAVAPHRRPRPELLRLARRADDADPAGHDRHERADAVVPLPPGARRPGAGDGRVARRGTGGSSSASAPASR